MELFNRVTGDSVEVDLFARMDTAVEKAMAYCQGKAVHVDVSVDADGAIEGVGFFLDGDADLLACITTYVMDRDVEEPLQLAIRMACQLPAEDMAKCLNQLLAAS